MTRRLLGALAGLLLAGCGAVEARARPPVWTVRDAEDRATVAAHADQMIFEGFDPEAV